VRQGLGLVAGGLVVGVAGALVFTRVLGSWVYGVSTRDPVTFLAVPALILVVAMGACLIPGWKAARIDPVNALRNE